MARNIANTKNIKIEALTFHSYPVGSLALGYILNVTDSLLIISLPGGVTGSVPINEVSDVLHQLCSTLTRDTISSTQSAKKLSAKAKLPELKTLVSTNMPVRVYVLEVIDPSLSAGSMKESTKRKSLVLSMRPSLINRGLSFKNLLPGFPVYGNIVSKEDHGYVVSTGMSGTTFFIPNRGVAVNSGELTIGQPIECVIESMNEGARTATVKSHIKTVSEAVSRGSVLPFNALNPGMLFNVVIDKIIQNGVLVNFLTSFHGVIDSFSLSRPLLDGEWQKTVSVGSVLLARIVYVDHGNKSIRFSLRPHVIDMNLPKNLPSLGEVLSDFKVTLVKKKVGVLLTNTNGKLTDTEQPTAEDTSAPKGMKARAAEERKRRNKDAEIVGVFIHRSSLADVGNDKDAGSKVEKLYKINKKIPTVRVMGHFLVEGWALASNTASYLNSEVVHWSQVKVGQLHSVEVSATRDFGLVLKISGQVRGICPMLHTSETGAEGKLHKKFKNGQKLNMRVWEVAGNAIIMTNKKSLIDTNEPILSYEDAIEDKLGSGVISAVSQEGLRVHFFNDVKGSIPMKILIKQGVNDPKSSYKVGQVIKCVVLRKTNPPEFKGKGKLRGVAKPRILLGLDIGDINDVLDMIKEDEMESSIEALENSDEATVISDEINNDDDQVVEIEDETKSVSVGKLIAPTAEFVSGSITKIEDNNIVICIDDGRLGNLAKHQCYDFASTSDAIFASSKPPYTVGSRVENALVLGTTKKLLMLSMKPLLKSAALSFSERKASISQNLLSSNDEGITIPNKVADLSVGQLVAGFVLKVESYGVLVKFRDNLQALCPRPNLAEKFVATPVGLFNVGDSIRCVIQRVELESERVIVTFKSAIVTPSTGELSFINSVFRERFEISTVSNKTAGKKNKFDFSTYQLGSIVEATVTSVKEYGVVMVGPNNTTMMLARGVHADESVEIGNKINVRVLDIDYENKVLDVSMDTDLINVIKSKKTEKKSKKSSKSIESKELPSVGSKVDARIELLKDKYLVVSINGLIAYSMVSDFHSPYLNTDDYKVHQSIAVKVERTSVDELSLSSPHSNMTIFSIYSDNDQRSQIAKIQGDAENSDNKKIDNFSGSKMDLDADPSKLRQSFLEKLHIGALLKWEVESMNSLEMKVVPENNHILKLNGIRAVIPIVGAIDRKDGFDDLIGNLKSSKGCDRNSIHKNHPFYGLSTGSKITCRVLQVRKSDKNKKTDSKKRKIDETQPDDWLVYLSLEKTNTTSDKSNYKNMIQWTGKDCLKVNTLYASVITRIGSLDCSIAISPYITAKLAYLDVSKDISMVEKFTKGCFIGQRVVVATTKVVADGNKKIVNVNRSCVEDMLCGATEIDLTKNNDIKISNVSSDIKAGQIVMGVIDLMTKWNPRPPSLSITISGGKQGRVCVTEINDVDNWTDQTSLCSGNYSSDVSSAQVSIALPDGKKHGDVVKCRVLSISEQGIELSLRKSRVNTKKAKDAIKDDILPIEGSLVTAYVANTSGKGCFLRLSKNVSGRVLIKDLSDEFVNDPTETFPMGKLVTARLLSINDNLANLSLKLSLIEGNLSIGREINKLVVGDTIKGTVQKIADFGVFIAISNTSLIGLSRTGAAVAGSIDNLNDAFDIGDIVRAKVLTVDVVNNKIGLGLKPSYFSNDKKTEQDDSDMEEDDESEEEEEDDDSDDDDEDEEGNVRMLNESEEEDSDDENIMNALDSDDNNNNDDEEDDESDEDEDSDSDGIHMMGDSEDESDAEMEALIKAHSLRESVESENNEEDEELHVKKKSKKVVKKVESCDEESESEDEISKSSVFAPLAGKNNTTGTGGMFQWGESFKPATTSSSSKVVEEEESDDDSEDDSENEGKGKRTRSKDNKKRKEEELVRNKEEKLLSGKNIPEKANDFERLLISQPNSSYLWIQYMAHHLESANIDGARSVCERALRTIGFREETEKYNVWMAYLNVEHKFGSMDSFEAVFKRATVESKVIKFILFFFILYF
jgi:rRNA biogenesis protein RRP5